MLNHNNALNYHFDLNVAQNNLEEKVAYVGAENRALATQNRMIFMFATQSHLIHVELFI